MILGRTPRKLRLLSTVVACWLLSAASAVAQPAPAAPSQAAPAAPSQAAPAAPDSEAAQSNEQAPPPAPQAAGLPPGHPPMGGNARVAQSAPAADLPPGVLVARVVDHQGQPQPGVQVRLSIVSQTVEEGESTSFKSAVTSPTGEARFEGLETASKYSYQVTVRQDETDYRSPAVHLRPTMGHRVQLTTFPVTAELAGLPIGVRGFVYIEPRDDVFQFEVLFRVFNMGQTSWRPTNVVMELPRDSKGFTAPERTGSVGFERTPRGAELTGVVNPGQHDASFRFQVPNDNEPQETFQLGMLPNVAELRVLVEAAPTMSLNVEGFGPAQTSTNQGGQRVLVTSAAFRGGESLQSLDIRVAGIPTPGAGKQIATWIAALMAAAGLFIAYQDRKTSTGRGTVQEQAAARQVLLDELVLLERVRASGEIGPQAYARTREALVRALARIVPDRPRKPQSKPAE